MKTLYLDLGMGAAGDNFSASKASEVYDYSLKQLTTLPKTDVTKVLIQTAANEPVYQFLDKKRSEGKPYNVYMTAGADK